MPVNPITGQPWEAWEIETLINHIEDERNADWLRGWSPMQRKLMVDGLKVLLAASETATCPPEAIEHYEASVDRPVQPLDKPMPAIRAALLSQDLYQVLLDVQNGIRSLGLKSMANGAIRKLDKARAEMHALDAAPHAYARYA